MESEPAYILCMLSFNFVDSFSLAKSPLVLLYNDLILHSFPLFLLEMLRYIQYICLLALLLSAESNPVDNDIQYEDEASLRAAIDQMKENQLSLQKTIGAVARQLMLQQLFVEERIRSDGHSGIKQVS